MANKNVYQLYIHIGDGEGAGVITPSNTSDKKDTGGLTAMTVYHTVQPFLSKTEQIIANNVDTFVGSSQVTQRVNLQMSIANKALEIGASIGSGASLATALGLSGGTGAIIGAVMAVANEALSLISNWNDLKNKTYVENEGLSVLRGRAGVQFNRSRGGE